MRRLPSDIPAWMQAQLNALTNIPDEDIDLSDIPELMDPDLWITARRGAFYRPLKELITLRLDADVLQWFKASADGGKGYQTAINTALRQHALREVKASGIRLPPNMSEAAVLAAANLILERRLAQPTAVRESLAAYTTNKEPSWRNPEEAIRAFRIAGDPKLRAEAAVYDELLQMRIKGGPCVCGCGESPRAKGSRFVRGHHFRLGKRLRESWNSALS